MNPDSPFKNTVIQPVDEDALKQELAAIEAEHKSESTPVVPTPIVAPIAPLAPPPRSLNVPSEEPEDHSSLWLKAIIAGAFVSLVAVLAPALIGPLVHLIALPAPTDPMYGFVSFLYSSYGYAALIIGALISLAVLGAVRLPWPRFLVLVALLFSYGGFQLVEACESPAGGYTSLWISPLAFVPFWAFFGLPVFGAIAGAGIVFFTKLLSKKLTLALTEILIFLIAAVPLGIALAINSIPHPEAASLSDGAYQSSSTTYGSTGKTSEASSTDNVASSTSTSSSSGSSSATTQSGTGMFTLGGPGVAYTLVAPNGWKWSTDDPSLLYILQPVATQTVNYRIGIENDSYVSSGEFAVEEKGYQNDKDISNFRAFTIGNFKAFSYDSTYTTPNSSHSRDTYMRPDVGAGDTIDASYIAELDKSTSGVTDSEFNKYVGVYNALLASVKLK